MNEKISLAMRMKAYEAASGAVLIPRMPTIIRVDGKAFHTFTRRIDETKDPSSAIGPSEIMHTVMAQTAKRMCSEIQNTAVAYTQSDEISFLLRDYDKHETQQWFGGKVQKIASVSASAATAFFNMHWRLNWRDDEQSYPLAMFDSRVFQIPHDDVVNYFVWRQRDADRNSVQFIARKFFSHKELHGKSNNEIQDMLWNQHNVNWNDYATWKKRGTCIVPGESVGVAWKVDNEIPIFTQDRTYIDTHVYPNRLYIDPCSSVNKENDNASES